ncbi:MerR family transcriptional regulator [Metabacillus niabensis]|uniref:DNA-binding transcriptional MerR regulator n=2 Tax=Metabacillus niabensis TaxID=324854 RepID=A0ABT9Z8L1_9BACI|nr:MerR family transcriptional regulator [Metabacillus niabensis]MDQ0228259.1 DNA-binding transcriptional MerR regulator [Metabacillus niabensis]
MKHNYSIGEFSKKTNVSIRTLHYYDELNILKPSFVSEKGRRFYSDNDLIELQKIITLKFLGFTLEEIKTLLRSNKWNLQDSLSYQKKEMMKKQQQIEKMINTLDRALHLIDQNKEVDPAIFTSLINNIQMEEEQKEWLKTILNEDRVNEIYEISDEKQKEIEKMFFNITDKLKRLFGTSPENDEVQAVVAEYIKLAEDATNTSIQKLFEELPDDIDDDPWLFPSPFTIEEEEWIAQAFEIYLKNSGVEIHGD